MFPQFQDLEEIMDFLGSDATKEEAWELFRLLEIYDQVWI